MNYIRCIQTPIGPLRIETDGQAVTRIRFGGDPNGDSSIEPNSDPNGDPNNGVDERADTPLLRQAVRELEEYFAGQRRSFTLPLAPAGTPFQCAVWEALRQIPYGQTRSYKQIAQQIGRPAACRAVGMANNRNPIPILIPCHRVVGADGSLTGYAGGLTVKSRLLAIERP
ncbi:methylated-DNA--[protein]-cysteine S-methyltransferase [Alistipes sp.]|uniref:methylated-DNA--[protein]-cysteine S-methyltransferase n=1 Tax=Alistipes sp. TaxID=1872444 RepID=UPI003AF057F5